MFYDFQDDCLGPGSLTFSLLMGDSIIQRWSKLVSAEYFYLKVKDSVTFQETISLYGNISAIL